MAHDEATEWIEVTNRRQDGTPSTRRLKISEMDQSIWFTTNGYSEVGSSVADLLANNLDGIQKVAEPTDPGEYYGDMGTNVEVVIQSLDASYGDLSVEGDLTVHQSATADSVTTDSLNGVRFVNGEDGPATVQSELDAAETDAGANQRQAVIVYGDGPVDLDQSLDVPNHVTYRETDEFSWRVPENHSLSTKTANGGDFLYAIANKDFSGAATGVRIENATVDFNATDDANDNFNHDQNAVGIWLFDATDSRIVDSKAENVLLDSGNSSQSDRSWGIKIEDSDDIEVRDSVAGPAGYEGLGVRGANTDVLIDGCEGIQGPTGVHSMQAAGVSGTGVTGAGAGDSITFRDCEGDAHINIHYGTDEIRGLLIEDCYMDGGYSLHGSVRNATLRDNSGGNVQLDRNQMDVDGLVVDHHDAPGENIVAMAPIDDGSVIRNVTVQNIQKESSGIVVRIFDDSTAEDAEFDNITVRSCTNSGGGEVGLVNVVTTASAGRVVVDDCYTNEGSAVRAQGGTIDEVVFRDTDFSDTTPTAETAGGTISSVVIDDWPKNDEYYYAANDAELDDVLSEANDGDTVRLGNATFSTNRTITTQLRIVGSGGIYIGGTKVTGDWTIDTACLLDGVNWGAGTTTTISSVGSRIVNAANEDASTTTFTVSNNDNIIAGFRRGDITLQSGTSGNVVDSSTAVTVTDNGTNTVGTTG